MGGRIWVDSVEGGGSSFAFELPLAQPAIEGE
jgi:signal transduction histidine kinase